MSRIGATISGIERRLLTQLSRVESAAVDNSIRLATGEKFSSPSDGPSDFFRVSGFEQRLNVVNATKVQVEIAADIGAEVQTTLDSMRTNLDTIREVLVDVMDGTITDTASAQTQIDDAIEAIDTLAQTEVNGRRYLNGTVNFSVSGRNRDQVSQVDVYSMRETTITGTVTSAATQAGVTYTSGGGGQITSGDATFDLTGERGTATLSVTNGENLTDVRDRINDESHKTGITAEVSGNDLVLTSVDYGDDAVIDIDVTAGAFSTSGTTQGSDAVATFNDIEISSNNVDGNRVTFSRNGLHFVAELTAGYTGAIDTMTVSDGQIARFALTPDLARTTQFSMPGLTAAHLGGDSGSLLQLASGGSLAGMGADASQAIRAVDEALAQLNLAEGRADSFADVIVQSSSDLLDGFSETLQETLEAINGVDEEEEGLLLTKNRNLASNAVAAMSILQQQQSAFVELLQQQAGL